MPTEGTQRGGQGPLGGGVIAALQLRQHQTPAFDTAQKG
ncbi:hypothetical protein XCR_0538 [Xanthomonas campestris pv. raphani 756C]|nr:hypothetical protein XCR_0538 [Xanthomonas campestris pv. raphani 756C]